jgi:hypothetical protein
VVRPLIAAHTMCRGADRGVLYSGLRSPVTGKAKER